MKGRKCLCLYSVLSIVSLRTSSRLVSPSLNHFQLVRIPTQRSVWEEVQSPKKELAQTGQIMSSRSLIKTKQLFLAIYICISLYTRLVVNIIIAKDLLQSLRHTVTRTWRRRCKNGRQFGFFSSLCTLIPCYYLEKKKGGLGNQLVKYLKIMG